MPSSRLVPPLDYLRAASRTSLQSFELARLNHAANLRSEIAALMDQWIQETSEAALARWILDHSESLRAPAPIEAAALGTFPESIADLLPAPPVPPPQIAAASPRFVGGRRPLGERIEGKLDKQTPAAST